MALEDSGTIRKAADDIRAAYGRADIVVNSAGFTRPVPHAISTRSTTRCSTRS